jgi:mevalonate kinase
MLVNTYDSERILFWESCDNLGHIWFEGSFSLPDLKLISFTGQEMVAQTLQRILVQAKKANPAFLQTDRGIHVTTKLQFPRDWGLGSSSTLINNIALWAGINAFELLFKGFGGSGYDVACAQHDQAILYKLDNSVPHIEIVDFDPLFKEQLYFVHLNKKQISSQSIANYKKKNVEHDMLLAISDISKKFLTSTNLDEFNELIKEHEAIISGILDMEPVQKTLFSDFNGQTKSLGAWGGDFILATGDESAKAYFKQKGFETVIPYTSMIKTL